MEDEIHWCWSQCCDLGPHACICGNGCEEDTSMMNKRTPKTKTVAAGWAKGHPFPLTTDVDDRYAEFYRWQAKTHADTLRRAAQDIPSAYQHGDSPSAWLTRRADQEEAK